MRRAITTLAAMLLALSMMVVPGVAETEPITQHCPGAVDETSPNYVAVPDGYEIVLDNDTTEAYSQEDRNETVLAAGTLVCIKGGPVASGIVVADGTSSLQKLLADYAGVNPNSGQPYDVSYYMTYRRIPNDPGQWCSPGFWRNSPIQAAAAAALVTEWPEGASLANYVDILNDPQQYASSGLYEAVADALSAAHAGVNFLGERVEDSCPLSADASQKLGTPIFGKKK
jgi:hypothetical protein